MSLQTPTRIRTRQRELVSQGEDTSRAEVSSRDTSIERPTIVGLAVKPVGKPCAGNPHARFDERGWETGRWPLAPSYRAHPRLYQTCRLPHRSDFVCFLRDFDRAGEATGMPVRDPELTKLPCGIACRRGATSAMRWARAMQARYPSNVCGAGAAVIGLLA